MGGTLWASGSFRRALLGGILMVAMASGKDLVAQQTIPETRGWPWQVKDVDASSPISAAFLNDHVAGSRGRVSAGSDGHLYLGGQRIRFFGINISSLPEKKDAGELAQRFAALGINIIRFHHMDAPWSGALLADSYNRSTRTLDAGALDRLDFFANELIKNGIYLNMNLLVGRVFNRHDGLPAEVGEVKDWKAVHAIGFWDDAFFALQQEYARQLLEHVNPYTGRRWKDEPALVMVEINNENSLLQAWLNRQLDELPEVFLKGLQARWLGHLREKYKTDEAFAKTFNVSQPLGEELIQALPALGRAPWNLERHAGAQANMGLDKGVLRIEVTKTGTEGWHVQFNQGGFITEDASLYTLEFTARALKGSAGKDQDISVGIGMAHEPWEGLGFETSVSLGPKWQRYHFDIVQLRADSNARLNFSGLGRALGAVVEIKDISLRPGGKLLAGQGSIEKGDFKLFYSSQRAGLSQPLLKEWLYFLYHIEGEYWQRMQEFLKQDIGVKALLVGSIVGSATVEQMNRFDIIDAHSYWNHPVFPGKDWDGKDYYVNNLSILKDHMLGGLGALSFMRVKGKPFSVTEYDHPWPNQYRYEMYPVLAAWAAWQDWDMIYPFSADAELSNAGNFITGYFDQLHDPLKVAALPFAARIFRQALVGPAAEEVAFFWDKETELARLPSARAWSLFNYDILGAPAGLPLYARVGLSSSPQAHLPAHLNADNSEAGGMDAELQGLIARLIVAKPAFPVDTKAGSLVIDMPNLYINVRTGRTAPGPTVFGLQLQEALPTHGCLILLKEGKNSLVLNSFAAGNTGEALGEYRGRLGRKESRLVNPLNIEKIRSTYMRGRQEAWAFSPRIELEPGFSGRLWAVAGNGALVPAEDSRALDPADKTLWWCIKE